MKKNKIIISLSLGLLLTSCNQTNNQNKNSVSEETIAQALDGEKEKKSNEILDSDDKEKKSKKLGADDWRDIIVDMGDFSQTLAKNLTDDQIQELVDDATKKSKETGYWDVKDFVFQELSRQYPELSNKFPLDTIGRRENWTASKKGEVTDKFNYERQVMADLGYPSNSVWSIDDKLIEDAFHTAYENDPKLYYDDYVKNAADLLFEKIDDQEENKATENAEDDKEKTSEENVEETDNNTSNNSDKNKLKKYGSSQTDYDAIKSALVQYYEFSPSSVNQMTNEDIDIAYTRALKRLDETGFGDIGVIFEELGKMYPGSSTMYPGDASENSESNN
ncbi:MULTISPECIES: hypothetical protein [Anaerococcus]|uniref:Lipoprotein n=1 Tax=Anaerococcus nagyae TaxID=1755241 RepID=A0A3E2TGP0_9FIRM|nr:MULTISPECIES: hypothetical protein [Anaerococcus]MDU1828091.1 hypothetical protein [Anaerococcus sp.]MDU1864456.1 hypothetical protein [Anaerococcus sp.]MDU2565033.1 hypothetical protein [Anaerococcus sp.]MDU3210736.1 hypothetical protein [Anaerococcus sp.]RGB75479.1 hypothetical protein DXA39_06640 [Anaerococcus nagyae]